MYYYDMPYIEGKTIYKYFDDETGVFLGSVEELFHHLKLLMNLRNEIKKLNFDYGIKHGDLSEYNII